MEQSQGLVSRLGDRADFNEWMQQIEAALERRRKAAGSVVYAKEQAQRIDGPRRAPRLRKDHLLRRHLSQTGQ